MDQPSSSCAHSVNHTRGTSPSDPELQNDQTSAVLPIIQRKYSNISLPLLICFVTFEGSFGVVLEKKQPVSAESQAFQILAARNILTQHPLVTGCQTWTSSSLFILCCVRCSRCSPTACYQAGGKWLMAVIHHPAPYCLPLSWRAGRHFPYHIWR